MLSNTAAANPPYFYAIGNTPAMCLTQHLPPDQDADLLLLGCGDVRNILFTNYAKLGTQQLDFTCCDIEPAIIARNVLFLSLIIDDVDNQHGGLLWEIYYHIRITHASRSLLRSQAIKLVNHSQSLATWSDGPYGQMLKFCNSQTLTRVRSIWSGYLVVGQSYLQSAFKVAKDDRNETASKNTVDVASLRSAAPVSACGNQDLPVLREKYWQKGCLKAADGTPPAKYLNPAMLFDGSGMCTLYSCFDPLIGFHVATAYMPLDNSQRSSSEGSNLKTKVVATAQAELRVWSTAFRDAITKKLLVMRFFSGDALTFAHTLQSLKRSYVKSAGLYSNAWTFVPLVLDSEDYDHPSGSAPVSYSVIDTSSLADTLGVLNILVATAPLLRDDASSTIYTDILFRHEAKVESVLDRILCGDFTTMSLLLGVAVVDIWTNATSLGEMDQIWREMSGRLSGQGQPDANQNKDRLHMPWKICTMHRPSSIHFSPIELAGLIHATYKAMVTKQSHIEFLPYLDLMSRIRNVTSEYHNHAGFVAFLHLLKCRITTDWVATIDLLLTLIREDKSFSIGHDFHQELITYLHMTGLHTIDSLYQTSGQVSEPKLRTLITSFSTLPDLVAVTVEVPAEKLSILVWKGPRGTPSLRCSLESAPTSSSQWLHHFDVVQSAFGRVVTEKTLDSGDTSIKVLENEIVSGSTSLVVSFYVPTRILLLGEDSMCVTVGCQSTPYRGMTLIERLGTDNGFDSFTAKMDDHRVHISRFMPAQQTYPAIAPILSKQGSKPTSPPYIARSTMSVNFNISKIVMDGLIAKIEIQGAAQEQLAEKSTPVQVRQVSATELELLIGSQYSYIQAFPRPVSAARSRLRVARKSSYVEIIAAFLHPTQNDKVDTFVYPITMLCSGDSDLASLVTLNIHTVNLDVCPVIDTSRLNNDNWMMMHLMSMFSKREWEQRQAAPITPFTDSRAGFKDGLFHMFRRSTGVNSRVRPARVFGLSDRSNGNITTLIFVSEVWLYLNDRAVLLDAAVVPLQDLIKKDDVVKKIISKLQSTSPPMLSPIYVDETELAIWTSIFPALAERCRVWKHKLGSCEYNQHKSVSPSIEPKPAPMPLCSCGLGQLPEDFMKGARAKVAGLKKFLLKHATRIAISPVYHVSYVESAVDLSVLFAPESNIVSEQLGATANEGCATCGKLQATTTGSTTPALLMCGRCKAVRYCSKECQKQHWKAHKPVCK